MGERFLADYKEGSFYPGLLHLTEFTRGQVLGITQSQASLANLNPTCMMPPEIPAGCRRSQGKLDYSKHPNFLTFKVNRYLE